jgi:hypothetical protein
MAMRLSEQLADLSVRAKNVEDTAAAAQEEAHEKLVVRKDQARAAATSAMENVDRQVKSVKDAASRSWSAAQAKINADMAALRADAEAAKHDRKVRRADRNADQLQQNAAFAVDYAIASVEQARLAVLDAIDGRIAAEGARSA